MRRILISTALSAVMAVASAAQANVIAITHAHIYSMGKAGEIAAGTVLVVDGQVAAVGADVKVPANARIIDAGGRIVTPGLFVTGAAIGASEIGGVEQTDDQGVSGGPLSAGFDIQYSLNPDSTLLPIERLTGATEAVVTPQLRGGRRSPREKLFAGQAAVIRLNDGGDILARPKVAMALEGGERGAAQAGGARGAFLVELRAALADTRTYLKNRAAYDQNRTHPVALDREDLEALIPVVQGREPLLVEVHRAADIHQILDFARAEKVRLVLSGVEEGWRVADALAQSNTPVLIDADEDLPYAFEALSSTLENAARMTAAGVSVSLHGPNLNSGGKAVRLQAGRAVSRGLPWSAGLASITINPARAFGVADRTGSIDPGKEANLVLWHGDPLDTSGAPDVVLIRGVEQGLRSRQLDLRDRYLKADNGQPPQYH